MNQRKPPEDERAKNHEHDANFIDGFMKDMGGQTVLVILIQILVIVIKFEIKLLVLLLIIIVIKFEESIVRFEFHGRSKTRKPVRGSVPSGMKGCGDSGDGDGAYVSAYPGEHGGDGGKAVQSDDDFLEQEARTGRDGHGHKQRRPAHPQIALHIAVP
jgi:hypothetical protein